MFKFGEKNLALLTVFLEFNDNSVVVYF